MRVPVNDTRIAGAGKNADDRPPAILQTALGRSDRPPPDCNGGCSRRQQRRADRKQEAAPRARQCASFTYAAIAAAVANQTPGFAFM